MEFLRSRSGTEFLSETVHYVQSRKKILHPNRKLNSVLWGSRLSYGIQKLYGNWLPYSPTTAKFS